MKNEEKYLERIKTDEAFAEGVLVGMGYDLDEVNAEAERSRKRTLAMLKKFKKKHGLS